MRSVLVWDASSVRRFCSSALLLSILERRVWTLGTTFGIMRCRKEELVLGLWIRDSPNACVCRYVDIRAPMAGRCVGSAVHCSDASRISFEGAGREGVSRRAERRRISSTSSAGSALLCVCFSLLDLEPCFEDDGGLRSRLRRAVSRR